MLWNTFQIFVHNTIVLLDFALKRFPNVMFGDYVFCRFD